MLFAWSANAGKKHLVLPAKFLQEKVDVKKDAFHIKKGLFGFHPQAQQQTPYPAFFRFQS